MEDYLDDGTWDDASFLAGLAALHGMCLACTGLPIAEQAHLLHPKRCSKLFTQLFHGRAVRDEVGG